MRKDGIMRNKYSFIIEKCYDSPFTGAALLDFDRITRVPPTCPAGHTLLKCTPPDQQIMGASQIMS